MANGLQVGHTEDGLSSSPGAAYITHYEFFNISALKFTVPTMNLASIIPGTTAAIIKYLKIQCPPQGPAQDRHPIKTSKATSKSRSEKVAVAPHQHTPRLTP